MKLLQKSQRLFLRISLPVFAVGGIVLFYTLRAASNHHSDKKLTDVRIEIETYVRRRDTLPVFFESANDRFYVNAAPQTTPAVHFGDTLVYNEVEKEFEPFRRLHFPLQMHGQTWQATLMQSTIDRDELAVTVALQLLLIFGLLYLILALVNQRVSRQVWTPFFNTLQKIHQFRLTDTEPLHLEPSDVLEFRELNVTLASLTEQVRQDFRTVKQFTENASHELQTPLAVIQNKVESLFQDEHLSDTQAHHIGIIGQSVRRMARLNQSLLLLSKIENHQFSEQEAVDFKPLVAKKMAWLEDFMTEKQLLAEVQLASVPVRINPFLAETLVANLLTNAVKHSLPGTTIHIVLDAEHLHIDNAAVDPGLPMSELTTRFARGNTQSEGAGLGLAMAAEICQQTGLHFSINFTGERWHSDIFFQLPHSA